MSRHNPTEVGLTAESARKALEIDISYLLNEDPGRPWTVGPIEITRAVRGNNDDWAFCMQELPGFEGDVLYIANTTVAM